MPHTIRHMSPRWALPCVLVLGCSSAGHTPLALDEVPDAVCPSLGEPVQTGTLEALALDEASGLVVSARLDDVLWSHNDGDEAALYAIDGTGRLLDTIALVDAQAVDVEDIARSATEARDILWLADIGDNDAQRPFVELLAVPEPSVLGESATISARVRVVYPDGPTNAEAFFIDPRSRDGYIITKVDDADSEAAVVFRVPGPLAAGELVAEPVATIDAVGPVTGADMREDAIVLRSAGRAVWWWVAPEQSVADALAEPPCGVPLGPEDQGEAIAFSADGYYTTSEGRGAPLHRVVEEP